MSEIDPVILQLRADLNGYLSQLRSTTRKVDELLGTQERRARDLEREMRRSSGAIAGHLKGLAATLATYFTGRELMGLIDGFTRLQNELRVAGLEGDNLATVQNRLFEIGAKYGVSVNALAELYGKSAMSAKELGASQSQLLTLTREVSQSLLITGTSTEQASGAIVGLSQALASGVVHAEEFNQMNDGGLRPLLAAAAATERWGGSVAKLRADIIAGKVSSQELFAAIQRGAAVLENQSGKAVLTLSGAFQALSNEMIRYVGSASSANGVTGVLSDAIKSLADNLDLIIPALATIALTMGVNYVRAAGAATIATIAQSDALFALQARLGGAATTAEALAFAMRGLGGLGVTAFILGVGAALYYMASRANDATDAYRRHAAELSAASGAKDKAIELAQRLASATDKEREATERNIAVTLKKTEADRAAAVAAMARAQAELHAAQARAADFAVSAASDGSGRGSAEMGAARGEAQRNLRVKTGDLQAATDVVNTLNETIRILKNPSSVPALAAGGGVAGKVKKGRATSGPTPEQLAARNAEEIARLEEDELRAKYELAKTAEERAEISRQMLALERDRRIAEVNQDKYATPAQKTARLKMIGELFGTVTPNADGGFTNVAGLMQKVQAKRDGEEQSRMAQDQLASAKSALEAQLAIEGNLAKRHEIENRILELQQQIEKAVLEEAIAAGRVADVAKARADLEAKQSADKKGLAQSQEGPLAAYRRRLETDGGNIKNTVEGLVVDELDNVRDGIRNAISNAIGTKDPLINGLLNLLIEQVIMKPLANALSNVGGGGGGFFGSVLGGIGNVLGGMFGRASGGYVAPGQMVRVNEAANPGRVEGFMSRSGGHIIPLGRMNAASPFGGVTVVQHVTVDARNSVNPDGWERRILDQAKSLATDAGSKAYQQSMKDAPAAVERKRRYG